MNIEIRRSFEKDALKLPTSIRLQLAQLIDDVGKAKTLSELSSCKKLAGFKNAYRLRMGAYRVGFIFGNGRPN